MCDVSIIVLTNNRSARCRDSLEHNTLAMSGVKAELIVINNGQVPFPIPQHLNGIPCRLIQMPRNMGAAARNEGLKIAQGQYVLTLDDDAYIDPGLTANMAKAFHEDASLGALTFRIHNGKDEESCLLPTVFHGCACGFRRLALQEVGGYPVDYLYYGEEYDLAFRLYQHGYRIGLCNHGKMVRHVRDTQGRNTDRILRLLVRNNVFLWASRFPWPALYPAVFDTLQRYAVVAAKERAHRGFLAGAGSIPWTLFRALRKRQPLSPDVFDAVSLNGPVRQVARELRKRNIREVTLCGVGKFPSLWLRTIRSQGVQVRQFLDFNPCWKHRRIHGVPVRVVNGGGLPHPEETGSMLTGTASLADNARWLSLLEAHTALTAPAGEELSSAGGIFDLHRAHPLKLYGEHFSEEIGDISPVAPALLYCVPAE